MILLQFEGILEKWTSLDVDNIFSFCFCEFLKLIKPYHCCMYSSFHQICSGINANKDVWLVIFWMMVNSLGKNTHNLLCRGCTRTKVMDSLYFLFWKCSIEAYFSVVVCASVVHCLSWREKTKLLWWLNESLLLGIICVFHGTICK